MQRHKRLALKCRCIAGSVLSVSFRLEFLHPSSQNSSCHHDEPPNHHAGGYYTTTNRYLTTPFRQPFTHTPRHPPDVSAATVIAIYVAAGFDRSGSKVEERQRNGENISSSSEHNNLSGGGAEGSRDLLGWLGPMIN
eukprot:scaffold72523_cov74-Cyclotella_meneghiniana.AAC.6